MSERTSYRIELTDFECRVVLDCLLSFGDNADPFGFDGDTMVSDSDHREGLERFCGMLEECSRHCKHDRETREDLKHRVEIGDYTQEEADRYADALGVIAGKIEHAVETADKEAELQEWYEAELEREAELWEQAGECSDTVN